MIHGGGWKKLANEAVSAEQLRDGRGEYAVFWMCATITEWQSRQAVFTWNVNAVICMQAVILMS